MRYQITQVIGASGALNIIGLSSAQKLISTIKFLNRNLNGLCNGEVAEKKSKPGKILHDQIYLFILLCAGTSERAAFHQTTWPCSLMSVGVLSQFNKA